MRDGRVVALLGARAYHLVPADVRGDWEVLLRRPWGCIVLGKWNGEVYYACCAESL